MASGAAAHRLLVHQSADTRDHLAGALSVRHDIVEGLADEPRVRRHGVERPLPRAGVGDDGRQRLIDLVSDTRRHFPQGPHPACPGELGLRLVQLLLGPVPHGDVTHDRHDRVVVAPDEARFVVLISAGHG